MIELSEVEGLKTRDKEREQTNTVQARKLERKRKLLEEARKVRPVLFMLCSKSLFDS